MHQFFSHLTLTFSIIAFAVALTQDGFYIDDPDPKDLTWTPGLGLLVFGWNSVLSGEITWMANPLLLLAWISYVIGENQISLTFAVISLILMVTFRLRKKFISREEASTFSKIIGYGPGYWLCAYSIDSAVVVKRGSGINKRYYWPWKSRIMILVISAEDN